MIHHLCIKNHLHCFSEEFILLNTATHDILNLLKIFTRVIFRLNKIWFPSHSLSWELSVFFVNLHYYILYIHFVLSELFFKTFVSFIYSIHPCQKSFLHFQSLNFPCLSCLFHKLLLLALNCLFESLAFQNCLILVSLHVTVSLVYNLDPVCDLALEELYRFHNEIHCLFTCCCCSLCLISALCE